MNTHESQEIQSEKKEYEVPTLIVYGDVDEITQSALKVGVGDAWALANLPTDCLSS